MNSCESIPFPRFSSVNAQVLAGIILASVINNSVRAQSGNIDDITGPSTAINPLQCWICSDYASPAVDLLTAGYNRRNVPRCPEFDAGDPNGTTKAYGNLIEAHNSGIYRCVVFHENDSDGKVVIRGMALGTTLDAEFGLKEGCEENLIFPKINTTRNFYVCTCLQSRCNSNSGIRTSASLSNLPSTLYVAIASTVLSLLRSVTSS